MLRLTAALIARDEEDNIAACLNSLKGLVDEVVLVDTGSTDQTSQIAAQAGAKVISTDWRNDFSDARNLGLAHATGEWILYIDADERVSATANLGPVLRDPNAVAARVQFRASSRLTPYREHRLFRNRCDIRFRIVIHETIMPDVRALTANGSYTIVDAPLVFDHLGYEGDLATKHRRNLPMLRRAVEQDPERVYLWHALGEAELGLGDANAAERAWRRGLATIRRHTRQPGDVLIYSDLLDLHFSENGHSLQDAAELVQEARRWHKNDPLTLWWTARSLVTSGDFTSARQHLNALLNAGPEGPDTGGSLGYDRKLFGAYPWGLLGSCSLADGEPQRALHWLSLAAADAPLNKEIGVKKAYAEALCRSLENNANRACGIKP